MAGSRKTVTVVFADIVGSTCLGEELDPEALRAVMERYFAEMQAVLERHGGTVEKFIGDAVVAVFGIPQVHEDDALRAVRAATEMRDRLEALNAEFAVERGVTIGVRTGVNTGVVVAGDPASGASFATGDAVNVAARLEQEAAAGEILLGEGTHRLVRDAVRAEAAGELTLKGKSGAVAAFRLWDVLPGLPAFERRIDTPLVGRATELALLVEALDRVRQGSRAELATIVGAAGIGKSRLIKEFLESVGGEARAVVGRCLSYGDGITFWPLGEMVRQLAPGDVRAGLVELLGRDEDAELVSGLVAGAIGAAEMSATGEEVFWGARRFFEALARDSALVAVVDDVHWAEPTFLDLLEYVAAFASAPVLLLCAARPDLLDGRPGWGRSAPNAVTLSLEPLSADEAEALVAELDTAVSADLRARIAATAEGNPLFVEQMLAFYADHEGDPDEITAPPTIQALLAARIDSLEPSERTAVECAAVEGRLFHRRAVSALLPEERRSAAASDLMALVRKQLVRPDRAEFPGDDGFRFVHALVRDAAYEGIPKAIRADLHTDYARWLEEHAGDRLPELEELLGYHLEQAFRYRVDLGARRELIAALGRKGAAHLATAGRRASARGDVQASITLLRRARNLCAPDDVERLELVPDLVDPLLNIGSLAEAETLLVEEIENARSLGVEQLELLFHVLLAQLRQQIDPESPSESGLALAERAVAVFESAGDHRGAARAWQLIHDVKWMRGRVADSKRASERALEHARQLGDIRLQAAHRTEIGAADFFGFAPADHVVAVVERDLAWARRNGTRWMEGIHLQALGALRFEQEQVEAGRELIARGRQILDDLGMRMTSAGLAVAFPLGVTVVDAQSTEEHAHAAYETLRSAGEKGLLSTVSATLAHVLYRRGEYEEAERLSVESEEAGASDDVSTQISWRGVRAMVWAQRGMLKAAEELALEAVARAEQTEYASSTAEAFLALGEVLSLARRTEQATTVLREALRIYDAKGFTLSASIVRARLADLQSLASPSQ